MMKGLTKRAHKLLTVLAQDEGRRNSSSSLLPEHFLLALIKTADGVGYEVLINLKINILSLQLVLEQSLKAETNSTSFADLPPSRRLRTLLDSAAIESRTLRNDFVGTEHLVIAAAKEENSAFSDFIKKCNLKIDDLRREASLINSTRPMPQISKLINTEGSGVFANAGSVNSQQKNNSQNASILAEFSRDITARARKGEIDPVVGRDKEINRVIQILCRRTKNNPVLIGEPGVGKTAIVEGLGIKIANGEVPKILQKKKLLVLDLALVIAGTKYRGEFEERIKRIMKEIREQKNIILFIDELHTIVGAGGSEGSMDASNMLKPALSRGELQCIGATTLKEYRKYFEKDAALERRFQSILVGEPSVDESIEILEGIKSKYEQFHGVKYEDGLMEFIVKYSQRYITGRFLPDKAIDVLDEAGSVKKINSDSQPSEIEILEQQISDLTIQKQNLVQSQDYEKAATVRDEVLKLKTHLEQLKNSDSANQVEFCGVVTKKDVCDVISTMTGIPIEELDENESHRLINMENEIHKSVVGQDEAINLISSAIRRSRAGVSSLKRPMGSFIFLGPTGVGKTLLAKTLAKFLFGKEDSLVRIDMSDYMEKHNASRLVGAPPGYVGYDEGGFLTEKIRRNPYSVVLLDEIEKAHPDVFNLLLQILEEGELKDNLGHTVNFKNTVIIMTSNAGVRQISNENRLGFSSDESSILDYSQIKSSAMAELKKIMSPELINRIDDIVVFNALSKAEISTILGLQISELASRLSEQHLSIQLTNKAR
ncbi:MAG: ATP-dependent Clp protease ATP-binding subunit, partial [Spirochaetaceae bacterium]|nr:ATP-dependent Clp protease ATP-binding subunit [Spirochaetaceae bacterium]